VPAVGRRGVHYFLLVFGSLCYHLTFGSSSEATRYIAEARV
jgi:hypothetical protein